VNAAADAGDSAVCQPSVQVIEPRGSSGLRQRDRASPWQRGQARIRLVPANISMRLERKWWRRSPCGARGRSGARQSVARPSRGATARIAPFASSISQSKSIRPQPPERPASAVTRSSTVEKPAHTRDFFAEAESRRPRAPRRPPQGRRAGTLGCCRTPAPRIRLHRWVVLNSRITTNSAPPARESPRG